MYKTLELDIKDRVATIWLNRPDVHNAFNEDLIEELTTCLSSLGIKEGIRAIVLAGRGKSFSAGADLNWMKRVANYTREQNLDDARALAEMLRTLNFISKPTIARVHGAALGGGLGLVACCDIAVASTSAKFATSEARLGLIPATIGPYVVAAIGERAARRYFLTAERLDAKEAHRIGLVHQICEDDKLDSYIDDVLAELLSSGPQAQAAGKDLIFSVANRPVSKEIIEDTAKRIAELRSTAQGREGVSAFLEKGKPSWTL